jgi:hypothetical protein
MSIHGRTWPHFRHHNPLNIEYTRTFRNYHMPVGLWRPNYWSWFWMLPANASASPFLSCIAIMVWEYWRSSGIILAWPYFLLNSLVHFIKFQFDNCMLQLGWRHIACLLNCSFIFLKTRNAQWSLCSVFCSSNFSVIRTHVILMMNWDPIVLYCIVLYCIILYCIVLYCIVLYCIKLYCIVLYCIVLYCIVLNWMM